MNLKFNIKNKLIKLPKKYFFILSLILFFSFVQHKIAMASDFSISITPAYYLTTPAQASTGYVYTITVNTLEPFIGSVSLSIDSGCPANTTCLLGSSNLLVNNGSASTSLLVWPNSSFADGTYNIVVTGNYSAWTPWPPSYTSVSHSATAQMNVSVSSGIIQGSKEDSTGTNFANTVSISGPYNYSAGGSPFSFGVVPVGSYTISVNPVVGFDISYNYSTNGGSSWACNPSCAGSSFSYNLTAGQTLDIKFYYVVSVNPMSGTLSSSAPSCVIASGAGNCELMLTWNTVNPVGTSAITASGMSNVNGNSGTAISFPVPYNARTFYLYNNGTLLAQTSVTSSCVSGTTWNGSICQNTSPLSSFSFSADSCLIENGSNTCEVLLNWNVGEGRMIMVFYYSPMPFITPVVITDISGSKAVSIPYSSRTFYLDDNGTLLAQKTITSSCNNGTWNAGTGTCQANTGPITVSVSASPLSMTLPTNATTITWTTTGSPSLCQKSGSWSSAYISASGGSEYVPNLTSGTYSFGVACSYDAYGPFVTSSVNVTVNPAPTPITVNLSVSPSSVSLPNGVTLSWTTTGTPESCSGSGAWSGSKTPSGGSEYIPSPSLGTQIFTITCHKTGVTDATSSATAYVNPPAATASISASPISIYTGQTTTVTWSSTNATSCTGTNFTTGGATSGSVVLSPNSTTTYQVTCSGVSAQATATVTVKHRPSIKEN